MRNILKFILLVAPKLSAKASCKLRRSWLWLFRDCIRIYMEVVSTASLMEQIKRPGRQCCGCVLSFFFLNDLKILESPLKLIISREEGKMFCLSCEVQATARFLFLRTQWRCMGCISSSSAQNTQHSNGRSLPTAALMEWRWGRGSWM